MIDPAWKRIIVASSASPLKPRQKAATCRFMKFELDRPSRFLLHDNRWLADLRSAYKLTDLDLHKVTAAKVAVDREIEQGTVAEAAARERAKTLRPRLAAAFAATVFPAFYGRRYLASDRIQICPRHHPSRGKFAA